MKICPSGSILRFRFKDEPFGMAVSQISGKEKTSPNRLEIPPETPTKIGKHNPSL